MDKRDFYRELMEEFAFDKEKIYLNAKTGKYIKNKLHRQSLPIYIGMTAAVAAVVVTVGTATNVWLAGRGGVDPLSPGDPTGSLPYERRIEDGKNGVREKEGSTELFNVLVTFERALSPAEVQSVLLARSEGSVPIKTLYMEDGSQILGADEVSVLLSSNAGNRVMGAEIRCAGHLMTGLQDDERVLLVEIIDPTNTEPIMPIVTDNNSNINTGGDSAQTPDSGTNAESSATDSSVASSVGETSAPESGVSEPPAPPAYSIENNISEVDGGYSPAVTTPESNSALSIPIDVMLMLPEGTQLPFDPDRFCYLGGDIGAKQAYFLNDNTVYVKTDGDIRLYTVNGAEVALAASESCADVKTFWIAENGGRLFAFGGGKLYDVNAESGKIDVVPLNVSGEIYEIAYNEDTGILALNVFENGNYSLIAYEGGFTDARVLYGSKSAFSLIAANSWFGDVGSVFFGAYSGSDFLIYKASAEEEAHVIGTIKGRYSVKTNAAFTHAVLDGDMTDMIFDPASFGLISIPNANVQFGVSKHSFLNGEGYFTIDNGGKTPSGGVSVIAKFDFKRSFSKYYVAAVENGALRIGGGVYTDRARNDYLTFEAPEENAPADMRMAVNAAVGLQNALTGGLCESMGVTETETLNALINACFGADAAAAVKARCDIGEGESLTYTSGTFYPINLSDTALVITDETENAANGTLYINAGSFDGRTAYYSCTVKLQKTENGYTADCIIE